MTTNDLIKLLNELDPSGEREVLESRYSDYKLMERKHWTTADAVPPKSEGQGWYMRSDRTMDAEDQKRQRTYVYFQGN